MCGSTRFRSSDRDFCVSGQASCFPMAASLWKCWTLARALSGRVPVQRRREPSCWRSSSLYRVLRSRPVVGPHPQAGPNARRPQLRERFGGAGDSSTPRRRSGAGQQPARSGAGAAGDQGPDSVPTGPIARPTLKAPPAAPPDDHAGACNGPTGYHQWRPGRPCLRNARAVQVRVAVLRRCERLRPLLAWRRRLLLAPGPARR